MARITATETRRRLKNLNTADISDTFLDDLAFIEGSEAYINVLLANNGITYASLSADKQTLVKLAEIAHCCWKIVTDAPEDHFKTIAIDSKPASGADKKAICDKLEQEWKDYLQAVDSNFTINQMYTGVNVGDNYKPDGEDCTNLLLGDTSEDVVSLFP